MIDIDWSKAPEDATHFDIRKDAMPAFMRLMQYSEDEWMWWGTNGWQYYGLIDRSHQMAQRPKQWTGEGLPPVGTVCEWHPNHDGWVQVEILGHNGEETWFRRAGESISETCLRMAFFRKIRTPEQIEAEEREKAINEIAEHLTHKGSFYDDAEILYNAGYRKVTP